METGRKKKHRIWIPAVCLLVVFTGFMLYFARYYSADETAAAAMSSTQPPVEKTDFGWFIDGPNEDTALIFYPGAKIEAAAYGPLLTALAEAGPDVFLVEMPCHIALLGIDVADGIVAAYPRYERWYIGGHSLGGVAAALYAAEHELDGVILLAAYPTKAIDEPMLIVCGTEDGLINRTRLEQSDRYGDVAMVQIDGGNHAGFGCYGPQIGDGTAGIDPGEQRAQTVSAVMRWLDPATPPG